MNLLENLALALLVSSTQSAAPDPYFNPDNPDAVIEMFEAAGFDVIETDTLWISDPQSFAIRMHVYDSPDTPVSAIRFYLAFDIGDSQSALEAVRYYEQTNLMAEVSILTLERSRQIILKRDVLLSGDRTPSNVVASAQLLFQLAPIFAGTLAQADPTLMDSIRESVQP
ncbi:MAG: hypothetical protein RIA71_12080 [Oceanicaulis sp.]